MPTNVAAVLASPGTIVLEERPFPRPAPGEVVVEVKYVGLCGSDLHFFSDGRVGSAVLAGPRVLGHEASGIVAELGDGVEGLRIGDSVAVDPGQSCGVCAYCQTGRYNLCERAAWDFLGTSKKDGALQRYIAHPASRVYALPDHDALLAGALLEPFAVAGHGVRRMGTMPEYGGAVVVLGCGCIGLMAILNLKRRFGVPVIAVDVVPARLAKARELGADLTVNSLEADTVAEVLRLTGAQGARCVYETAGVPATVGLAADCAARGGKIVFVGTTVQTHVEMHFNAIMRKELDMTTVFRFAGELRLAADALGRGPLPLDTVVTDRYPFEQAQAAFANNVENKANVVKTVIEVG